MLRCLTALGAGLVVTACAFSPAEPPAPVTRTVVVRPVLPAIARTPCDPPAVVPAADLTERQVVSLWGRDRVALKTCETRRAAAVTAVDAAKEGQD